MVISLRLGNLHPSCSLLGRRFNDYNRRYIYNG
uniref:Uncharacterized protein n=1 Tax=Siphoviridae sp. ctLqe90 TaxID=2825456 RepID=A0A8S5Q1L4_9CAUD|nr:MAG TPA: hypothetical protein [Siphoviridae sp. ctLqe90]